MKTAESKALDLIYNSLMAGKTWGYLFIDVQFPFFQPVLYPVYDVLGTISYFGWCNYGSSANEPRKEAVSWLLENIFKLTALDFVKKYQLRTIEICEELDKIQPTEEELHVRI